MGTGLGHAEWVSIFFNKTWFFQTETTVEKSSALIFTLLNALH